MAEQTEQELTCIKEETKKRWIEREHWTDVYSRLKNEGQSHNKPIVGNKFFSRGTIEGADIARILDMVE